MFHQFLETMPSAVCLVFGALLLLERDRSGRSARIMGFTLLSYIVILNTRTFYRLAGPGELMCVNLGFGFFAMAGIALTTAYFCMLANNRLTHFEWLMLLPPPVLLTTLIGLLYLLAGRETSEIYLLNTYRQAGLPLAETSAVKLLRLFDYTLFNYILLAYLAWGVLHARRLLKRYNRRLREYYAMADDKGGREIYFAFWTLLLFVLTAAAFTLFAGVSRQVSTLTEELFALFYTLSLFLIGRRVLKLPHTAADLDYLQRQAGSERRMSQQDAAAPEQLDNRLQALLTSGQNHGVPIWKDPELTLDKLAARLQTDRESLERLFGERYGIPFADYLDTLRVTAAERMLSDPETDYTPEQIALSSGFASKASFIRVFRRMQGVTPEAWREMHRNLRRDGPDQG